MITTHVFNNIVFIWIVLGLLLFPVLLKIAAPYGRHTKTTWGPMINNRIAWFLMESPALFVFLIFVLSDENYHDKVILLILLLWCGHYLHRALIFPLRINTGGKKMPVLIMMFAVIFNSVNGFINGYWFGYLAKYPKDWFTDTRFIAGAIFVISGLIINQYHDRKLIKLREKARNGYEIPYGGLFRLVSCPNYLGEIIQWGGFALMTWCLPALSFFVWTMVNLLPRAIDHHKWYRNKFKEYPEERKAIIPFLV